MLAGNATARFRRWDPSWGNVRPIIPVNVSAKEITSYPREIKRLWPSTPKFARVTSTPSGSCPARLLVANDNWNCRCSCRRARWLRRPRTLRQPFNKVDEFPTGEQVFLSRLPKIVEGALEESLLIRHKHIGPVEIAKLLVIRVVERLHHEV
jgi:hypothetical protein